MSENENRNFNLAASSKHEVGLMADIILRNAVMNPDRFAFVSGNRKITYKAYNELVNRTVHAMTAKGMKKGDTISIISWNSISYTVIFGVSEKGGFIIAPINTRLNEDEIQYLINDSKARVLFVGPEFKNMVLKMKPRLTQVKHFIGIDFSGPGIESMDVLISGQPVHEPEIKINDDDPLFICYTSGTSGRPKGALYTHGCFMYVLLYYCRNNPTPNGWKHTGQMPLFHIGGIRDRANIIVNAGTYYIFKKFDPRAMAETIEKEKLQGFALVPTQLAMLLDLPNIDKYDLSSVRKIGYAASPMPVELLKRALKKFGPIFTQAYGQTESGPDITTLYEEDHNVIDESNPELIRRLRSCGRPVFGVQVRIVNEIGEDLPPGEIGEVISKSRHNMKEYWNLPEETEKKIRDGWLHTGDMGYYDTAGYIYLVDRKEDMIVTGGENVYPREVEEILYTHPAVRECSVFGIPDPKWVESVHAVISLRHGKDATPDGIIQFCKENMSRYKAPKSVEIIEDLPKNATGKILKRSLKKRAQVCR